MIHDEAGEPYCEAVVRKSEWSPATATLGEVGDHAVKESADRVLELLAVGRTRILSPIYSAVQNSSGLA
jgi:hypothetical protein